MATESLDTEVVPPYIPWTTFENLLEKMRLEGMPERIDRSYLRSYSGSTQQQLLAAARFLGLVDRDGNPSDVLKALVRNPEDRPNVMAGLVRERYPEAMALSNSATSAQLDEAFRKAYPTIHGETVRKAIAFFLNAARFAKIELSPHFPQTRPGGGGRGGPRTGTRRTTRTRNRNQGQRDSDDEEQLPPTSDAKSRYVDLLLKKAEEEMDEALLDRIERVIGVQAPDAENEE
jgi:hypothetical protein